MDFVDIFPVEISLQIFRSVPAVDLLTCWCVSKNWLFLANDPLLWRHKVIEDFELILESKIAKNQVFVQGILKNPSLRNKWKFLYLHLNGFLNRLIDIDNYEISLNSAAVAGDFGLLKLLLSRCSMASTSVPLTVSLFNNAVLGGSTEVVTYLLDLNCPVDVENVLEWAAKSGCIDLFNTLCQLFQNDPLLLRSCYSDSRICNACAQYGHLDCLKFVHEVLGFPFTSETSRIAAQHGDLDVLNLLSSEGCQFDLNTYVAASRCGSLTVFRYVQKEIACHQ